MRNLEYCCAEHQNLAKRGSARLVRDAAALGEELEEAWLVTSGDLARPAAPKPSQTGLGMGSGMVLVTIALALAILLPRSDSGMPINPVSYLPKSGALGDQIAKAIPARGSLSLRDDFSRDLRDWQPAFSASRPQGTGDWVMRAGSIYPGKMRLWQPTVSLKDYQVEFETKIEAKAASWVVRAADNRNYYATKLLVSSGSNHARAEISRWVMHNGASTKRVTLPIPISIQPNVSYDVKVRVKGSRLTTLVNNQLVDSWTDQRLALGGVGFFSEPGERAALNWVSIRDGDSFWDRFLNFGFIVGPIAGTIEAE
jgi:hypothetical protein